MQNLEVLLKKKKNHHQKHGGVFKKLHRGMMVHRRYDPCGCRHPCGFSPKGKRFSSKSARTGCQGKLLDDTFKVEEIWDDPCNPCHPCQCREIVTCCQKQQISCNSPKPQSKCNSPKQRSGCNSPKQRSGSSSPKSQSGCNSPKLRQSRC